MGCTPCRSQSEAAELCLIVGRMLVPLIGMTKAPAPEMPDGDEELIRVIDNVLGRMPVVGLSGFDSPSALLLVVVLRRR